MGATKRAAEIVLQNLTTRKHDTIFSMVRFGNVLGSSGSVVPLFTKQIKEGGPVTVTHQDINRYFMTIPEAASLVIQAGSMAKGGELFVLDMGGVIKIADLARKMITLMGHTVKDKNNPSGEIEVLYTGLRPGEKLYEELLIGDNVSGTNHSKIMMAEEAFIGEEALQKILVNLELNILDQNAQELQMLLKKLVLEYHSNQENVDLLVTSKTHTNKPNQLH